MIDWERRMLLKHYLEQGEPIARLAKRLRIGRRTIHRLIAIGHLERDLDAGRVEYSPRPPVVEKLDPYKPVIEERLRQYPHLSSVRLLEEIRAAGYAGGYTQVKEFVRAVRPREVVEPVVRFETPPGLQGQVDFAEFQFPWGKRYALVVVLGYSRLMWLRFYERQDMQTLFRGLEEAFRFFGGVPEELLFDQMKAVITRDLRLLGGQIVVNEEFKRFAAHWGFRPRACRPYRAKTKGKVERPIRYVRENFVYGREFLGDAHLDAEQERWLAETANVRIHATTKERPAERFEQGERSVLLPLAERPYQSLVLIAPKRRKPSTPVLVPPARLKVEQRPLAVYDVLVAGAA
jgi:transposase